jgi:hypothetical protein
MAAHDADALSRAESKHESTDLWARMRLRLSERRELCARFDAFHQLMRRPKSVEVGRSLTADRGRKAKGVAKRGQGDRGDERR